MSDRAALTGILFVLKTGIPWEYLTLKIRYEHRADIHLAFLELGCALISLGFLG